MDTAQPCPNCGKPVVLGAPQGLCPECLMKSGFETKAGNEAGGGKSAFVPPTIEQMTKLFPQLEIIELLGQGGMGAVYKARQPRLNRFVALKILSPEKQNDPQFAERFEREARALAALTHPNIVTVYDFGETQGNYYLLMEFVDGMTLRQLYQARKLSSVEALTIVPKICDALQYAHEQGIVHRDIKPENILLDKNGRVKIADFGIAKILDPEPKDLSLTGAKDVVGTPHYMAPEQIEKPQTVDSRADIYSLGVVFYEMLTGELPLGKFQPPSQRVQIDVRLDEVVLHALEKEPDRRYQKVSEVKTDVETIATTTGANLPPISTTPPLVAGKSNGWKITLVAGGFVLIALIIICGVIMLHFGMGHKAAGLPRNGLVALWSGDGNGDDSAGRHNARVPSELTYAPAKVGQGFRFDGVDHNRILVPNAPELNFGDHQDFSITAWIQPLESRTTTGVMSIVDKRFQQGDNESPGYVFSLENGRIQTRILHMGFGPAGPDLRDGQFHHVVLTIQRDSTMGGHLYVDGQPVLAFDTTALSGDLSNDQPLRIGNHCNPSYNSFFKGIINQLAIYNRALTPAEIKTYYDATKNNKNLQPGHLSTTVAAKVVINSNGFENQLDDDQRLVLQYINRKFKRFSDERTFDGWSLNDRAALEQRLLDTIKGPRSDEYYKAINSLAALHSTNALPLLREMAFDHKDTINRTEINNRPRWMAVRAMSIIGDKTAVPEMIHLLYHNNSYVRWSAQISLVRLTGQNFGNDWQAWGKSWNEQNGNPPFSPEVVHWWRGQAEPAELANELAADDQRFLDNVQGKKYEENSPSTSTNSPTDY
jgi:serine/threonine protein kinase